MWWRAKKPRQERSAWPALARIGFVAVLLIVGPLGSAQACPDSKRVDAQSSAVMSEAGPYRHAPITVVSTAPNQTSAKSNRIGACCGTGCPKHSAACGNACCLGGPTSVAQFNVSPLMALHSAFLHPFDQAELIESEHCPALRPPCIVI